MRTHADMLTIFMGGFWHGATNEVILQNNKFVHLIMGIHIYIYSYVPTKHSYNRFMALFIATLKVRTYLNIKGCIAETNSYQI